MSARAIFVMCEGTHDIAFLTRLLSAGIKAEPLELIIKDLPKPLGDFFVSRFERRTVGDAKFANKGGLLMDDPPVLETAWASPDGSRHWYFLNCRGNSQHGSVKSFLMQLAVLTRVPEPDKGLSSFGLVFVNDADDDGIAVRLARVCEEYGPSIRSFMPTFEVFPDNFIQKHEGFAVGACVFAKAGEEKGTLEDIVWPLMHSADSPRHDAANTFVTTYAEHSSPSKRLKAALTIAGQPECPGNSLTVVLRDSLFLKADDLISSNACNRLLEILSTV